MAILCCVAKNSLRSTVTIMILFAHFDVLLIKIYIRSVFTLVDPCDSKSRSGKAKMALLTININKVNV